MRALFNRKEEGAFFNNSIFLSLQCMESSFPEILLAHEYIWIFYIYNYFTASSVSRVVSLQITAFGVICN